MGRIGLAVMLVSAAGLAAAMDEFAGKKAGEERTIAGVRPSPVASLTPSPARW
jgi:hypothetical protein